MRLSVLCSGIVENNVISSFPEIEIIGITSDSRQVKPGYLFAALSKVANGFIPQAINSGAVAILSDVADNQQAVYTQHPFPKSVYHKLAARFYSQQPKHIIAVTGTNGKTSVVNFCQQLWQSAHLKSVGIGTIGVTGNIDHQYKTSLTTPDAMEMHYILNDLVKKNVNYVAIEASSHGLAQFRLHSVKLSAAAFTNLSLDHGDYHQDFNDYFQSKQKLFTEILSEKGVVVLNADIPEYEQLLKVISERKVISYGEKSNDIKLIQQVPQDNGQIISFSVGGKKEEVFFPILGQFQAYNILCALGLVYATNITNFNLQALRAVDGRMQLVVKDNYRVVVDYAHTPDALKSVLMSLKWHINFKRIILVFGCGGDRDRKKRAMMGQIAQNYADFIIVCDDNPRTEDPGVIRQEIIATCPQAIEIADRKKAISVAINEARSGDVILVAGKGHEDKQITAAGAASFHDISVINSMLFK